MTWVRCKVKEGKLMAFLLKVEQNYSEVFVSQPYVPSKRLLTLTIHQREPCREYQPRARGPCLGMWDLDRLYLANSANPLIIKMASTAFMQVAA